MDDYQKEWELFSKTGDIDAYLAYKSHESEFWREENGKYKNEGFDNKDF
ncbi:MAG: YqzL family protein [Clostridia bacterium]|nr:YqzL family protein [Clostridia bacterium]